MAPAVRFSESQNALTVIHMLLQAIALLLPPRWAIQQPPLSTTQVPSTSGSTMPLLFQDIIGPIRNGHAAAETGSYATGWAYVLYSIPWQPSRTKAQLFISSAVLNLGNKKFKTSGLRAVGPVPGNPKAVAKRHKFHLQDCFLCYNGDSIQSFGIFISMQIVLIWSRRQ